MTDSITDALNELASATDDYVAARARSEDARRDECTALNRLNSAQKKVDEVTATFRKGAPCGSDWNRPSGFSV